MNKSPQYNKQKLRKYVFTRRWKAAVTTDSISEKKMVSMPENILSNNISESSRIQ